MSFIRYVFLGLLGLILVTLMLANRQIVSLKLIPDELGVTPVVAGGISMPLFLVIFLAIALGLLIGFTWEWLREHKHRAEARSQRAQKERLEKELAKTRARSAPEDDVLALVERPR
ncbi:lipopolysaccharide assembly protein LapA domain-containing protein [Jannaschia formosa]|uniref:lipopolysaccharide assembly protein LapA domain-containing protein n=1 Tax=Jannaschia formosa TaxID=2259592 RepID=UPI000E1B67B5|nr:LapA family protein [Jannaschia formosa]TFL18734.1 LapA family protein [Jannaschia formosa]